MIYWVMQVWADNTNGVYDTPMYLKWADVTAYDGRGNAVFTVRRSQAKRFATMQDVMDYWKEVPANRPLREDGKPNRPLTTFSISPEKVDE